MRSSRDPLSAGLTPEVRLQAGHNKNAGASARSPYHVDTRRGADRPLSPAERGSAADSQPNEPLGSRVDAIRSASFGTNNVRRWRPGGLEAGSPPNAASHQRSVDQLVTGYGRESRGLTSRVNSESSVRTWLQPP